jgi:hypothetical protein
MTYILAMNTIPDKCLIEEVALVRGIGGGVFIEKDWFVTQAIKILAESQQDNFMLVLTGGTALSKAAYRFPAKSYLSNSTR